MDISEKFELHYYFADDSHAMDAIVRNKCEAEVIAIIQEISAILNIPVNIESEAYLEGGLRDLWKIFSRNSAPVAVLVSIISVAISLYPKADQERVSLEKEDLQLSVEERRLKILLLRQQIKENGIEGEIIETAKEVINNNYKIITRRSNFYKELTKYQKVSKIGVIKRSVTNQPLEEEIQIQRKKFYKFILKSHKLPPEVDEDAIIELISPVIKSGNYSWKGIYKDEPITFLMNDQNFRHEVLSGKVTFQSGAIISCVLEKGRKLDEVGEVKYTGYTVTVVQGKEDKGIWEETPQGKRYKFTKRQKDNQNDLFE